jgi:hypothetical protein
VAATPRANRLDWDVPDGTLFRVGDTFGRRAEWRSASPPVEVLRADGARLQFVGWLDGALAGDVAGFADFQRSNPASPNDLTTLRLETPDAVGFGERIVLMGRNAITDRRIQLDAVVGRRVPGTARFEFTVPNTGFSLRPEKMAAATLYNPRFADLFAAYARKNGLYVAWLGCHHESRECPALPETREPCREKEA